MVKNLDKNNIEYIDYEDIRIFEESKKEQKKLKEEIKNQRNKDYEQIDQNQINELFGYIDNLHNSFEKEILQCKKHIYQEKSLFEKNLVENSDIEIGGTELIIESFEEYKLREFSLAEFKNFVSSDEGSKFIKEENLKYLEIYGHPIDIKTLVLKLKNYFDKHSRKEYDLENYTYNDEYYDNLDTIENNIDYIIVDYIKNGGKFLDENIINQLENLFLNYESLLEDWEFKDRLKELLQDKIKNFYNTFNTTSLNTKNAYINLEMKLYLFIYGKIFLTDIFEVNQGIQYYENILPDIMVSILVSEGDEKLLNEIKNKKLLEEEKKAEQERKKRELKRRQEAAARKNRERNNSLNKDTGNKFQNGYPYTDNTNDNSGANLVKKSGVNLSDFSIGGEDSELNMQTKYITFRLAWNKFMEYNDNIKNIITYEDMIKLYNMETDNIDEGSRKTFLETDIMKGRSNEEISQIYKTLQSFSNNYHDAIKNISSKIIKGREKMDDKIKMYALGAVIDNVKNVFDSIVSKWQGESKFEGFSFNSHEPVKRQGNDIIISGKFNGADIKIRYNLLSGGLFMNSFIQHLSPSKITIGNNTDADYRIGQLESFDTILEEHYHSPRLHIDKTNFGNNGNRKFNNQNNIGINGGENENNNQIIAGNQSKDTMYQSKLPPTETYHTRISKDEIVSLRKKFGDMLNANIDLIGDAVVNYTKEQSIKNSVIIKFMKTFNIVSDEDNIKAIDISNESNMFDFIQIIENSDSTTLESFQIFMGKIMEYVGLSRGNNNLQGPQRNQKSDLILDENNDNKYVSLLRNSFKDFSNNLEGLKGKLNFDSSSQIGFIEILIKNITNGTSKPNWKLDETKMDNFFIEAGLEKPF